ncbi:MAG: peptidylprolyl isomerase [Candidatus Saccharibacteria bacterium]
MTKKKLKKFKSDRLKKAIEKIPSRKSEAAAEDKLKGALSDVSKITEETLPEHREEVLGSARKYIYPLKHSRHHFVRLSLGLLLAAVVIFFVYSTLEIYYFQSSSDFIYSISEVLPFPAAKAGSSWVSYYSYLFELRRNIHYYETQQGANFSSANGKLELTSLKKQAMDQVVLNAYVKQLASKNKVKVTDAAVNNQITLVRQQNRLGNSNQVLQSVLKDYWGWTMSDFKQELTQELLQQAVVAQLDTATNQKANLVYSQLKTGATFSTEALQYSDDTSTKSNGGQYSFAITPSTQSVAPQIASEVFNLKPGDISPIINTGYALDIIKDVSSTGNSVQAADIQFNFQPINVYTDPLEKASPPRQYIHI